MIRNFAQGLLKEFQQELQNKANYIAEGRCRNFDEYKHACGCIQGLTFAVATTKSLLEKVENDDE